MTLAENTHNEIEKFKRNIIDSTLLIGTIIGFLAYVVTHIPFDLDNKNISFYTDFISFIVLFSVYAIRKKLSAPSKAYVVLIVIIGFVITDAFTWGLYSFNKALFVLIPFYALLVFSLKKTVLVYLFATTVYLVIGYLFIYNHLNVPSQIEDRFFLWSSWVESALLLGVVSAVIIIFTKKYNKAIGDLIQALDSNNTELKEREKNLEIEQIFTNSLLDSLPGLFNLYKKTDDGFVLVKWNKNTEILSGIPANELPGKNPLFIIDPDHRDVISKVVENIALGKIDSNTAKSWHISDPSKNRWHYFTGHPTLIDGEEYFIGTGIDITNQKKAELLFEEARKFSDRILDIFPGMFYMYEKVTSDFSLIQWNKNVEIETGYTASELYGVSPNYFFTEEYASNLTESLKVATLTGFVAIEAPILKKNGTGDYWYFVNQVFKEGEKEFLIGFGIDISERKVIERELEHKNLNLKDMVDDMLIRNKKLAEYAFINSHLLRAPLARILGLAELVSKEVILSEHGELLENFITSAKELDAIVSTINEVLDSRKDLNRQDIIEALNKKSIEKKSEKN